jgi:hypothetical protein
MSSRYYQKMVQCSRLVVKKCCVFFILKYIGVKALLNSYKCFNHYLPNNLKSVVSRNIAKFTRFWP